MKIKNPTNSDIVDYNFDRKLYTIKGGETVDVPDDAGSYLMRIYGFLEREKRILQDEAIEQTVPVESVAIDVAVSKEEVEKPKRKGLFKIKRNKNES